jgi:hypothetical protein
MLRTLAVLLLLLGLATATPIVCLCAPDGVAGMMAQPAHEYGMRDAGGTASSAGTTASAGLLASSAAAAIASVIPTAAGVPSSTPWQLAQPPSTVRVLPPVLDALLGQAWPPDAPPPQSA